ncbi:hypothetical protein DFH28DRAFT_1122715 [Melampsora americana]|nr:hypothetical protein DFH28DRAFT_1122715 [Melampsora americana]
MKFATTLVLVAHAAFASAAPIFGNGFGGSTWGFPNTFIGGGGRPLNTPLANIGPGLNTPITGGLENAGPGLALAGMGLNNVGLGLAAIGQDLNNVGPGFPNTGFF